MKNNSAEIIESAKTEIIKALEEMKDSDVEHAEFYRSLQERQIEIVRDLEAVRSANESRIFIKGF